MELHELREFFHIYHFGFVSTYHLSIFLIFKNKEEEKEVLQVTRVETIV